MRGAKGDGGARGAPPRVILVCSPKGGSGKTTLSRLLLAGAGRRGLRAVGLDLDPQSSLNKWFVRRSAVPELNGGFVVERLDVEATPGRLHDLEAGQDAVDLVVVDTPPSMVVTRGVRELVRRADLVLVPVQPSVDDHDAAVPWMAEVRTMSRNSAFVQNRVNRSARWWQDEGRAALARVGKVCHTALPDSEDIRRAAQAGAVIGEIAGGRSVAAEVSAEAVFDFVAMELGL